MVRQIKVPILAKNWLHQLDKPPKKQNVSPLPSCLQKSTFKKEKKTYSWQRNKIATDPPVVSAPARIVGPMYVLAY